MVYVTLGVMRSNRCVDLLTGIISSAIAPSEYPVVAFQHYLPVPCNFSSECNSANESVEKRNRTGSSLELPEIAVRIYYIN
jgi:hypothetical protein